MNFYWYSKTIQAVYLWWMMLVYFLYSPTELCSSETTVQYIVSTITYLEWNSFWIVVEIFQLDNGIEERIYSQIGTPWDRGKKSPNGEWPSMALLKMGTVTMGLMLTRAIISWQEPLNKPLWNPGSNMGYKWNIWEDKILTTSWSSYFRIASPSKREKVCDSFWDLLFGGTGNGMPVSHAQIWKLAPAASVHTQLWCSDELHPCFRDNVTQETLWRERLRWVCEPLCSVSFRVKLGYFCRKGSWDFVLDRTAPADQFGSIGMLTAVGLPTLETGCLSIYWGLDNFFSDILKFSVYMCYTYFVKFIPKCFLFYRK